MFSSFAQLASSLEASLSLDALQASTTGETKSADNPSHGKPNLTQKGDLISTEGHTTNEETELLLVEEVSRLSELLRLKDGDLTSLQEQHSEALGKIQSKELAISDVREELEALKLLGKSTTDGLNEKYISAEREICDLKEEVNRQKKSADEKSSVVTNLQALLLTASNGTNCNEGNEEDKSQLQIKNETLKLELDQLSTLLSYTKSEKAALEELLNGFKASTRTHEDQQAVNQRDLTSLRSELSQVHLDWKNEIESSRLALAGGVADRQKLQTQHETEMNDLKAKVVSLEKSLAMQKDSYDALDAKCGKQISADAEKSSEMDDLYRSLSQASDANEEVKLLHSVTQAELVALTNELIEKNLSITELQGNLDKRNASMIELESVIKERNTTIADLQAKQTTLTEKTKDIVKKYSEMKTKNQNLESAGDEKYTEAIKNLQQKESEILSLRMKLENTERGLGDQRAMALELAERYGDTQRELGRAKAAAQEHMLTIENQTDDIEKKNIAALQLNAEKAQLVIKVDSLQTSLRALEAQVFDLKEDKARIEEQLKSGDDSARVLDEYKKRAQMALKKSNSASAAATSELAAAKRSLTDALQRVAEVEESLSEAVARCEELETELSRVSKSMKQLELERDQAVQVQVTLAASESSALLRIRELEHSAQRTHTTAVSTTPTPHSFTGDTASTVSDRSLTSKSLGSSDDDLVLVSSMVFDSSEPSRGKGIASDSLPHSGSIEMKKVGGVSATSSRRAPQSLEQDPPQSLITESDVAEKEDIDLARSSSDKNKKVQSSDQLYYVNELYTQMDELKREVQVRGAEADLSRQELQNELVIKRALEGRVEELLAYLDRSKKFQGDGPDFATNTEYLKNCVYRFMATTEHSERRRLAPVISTILKLTSQEKKHIDWALSQGDTDDSMTSLASIGAFAGSFFGATPHTH